MKETTMNTWLPIKCRGFWDVPRVFLVHYDGSLLLFVSPFLEELDEYADSYGVYVLPEATEESLPSDWTTLIPRASHFLGEIAVQNVTFDSTRRKQMRADLLEALWRTESRPTAQ
jgi:hypothetical protein